MASQQLRVDSTLKLNDGRQIPQFGLGIYLSKGNDCVNAIKAALAAGYRVSEFVHLIHQQTLD